MRTSTEIASAARLIGEERAIEEYAKAGFDGWDFSMFAMCIFDWKTREVLPSDHPLAGSGALAFARRLKQVGLDNGIPCNQSHAPFPSAHPVIRDKLRLAIECTAEAGGSICVIHPDNDLSPEQNAEMFQELLPTAHACGVKIATENMWNWRKGEDHCCFAACSTPDSFNAHLDAVDDPFFVACLDIGHAEMDGLGTSAVEMIHALGGRLQALHIHDNDRRGDLHQIPFSMDIDFPAVAAALRNVGYSGWLTLEADRYLSDFTAETAAKGIADLAAAAHRFEELFLSAQA